MKTNVNFTVTKDSTNKILNFIRKIKHKKTDEEKIYFLANQAIRIAYPDLLNIIKKFEKNKKTDRSILIIQLMSNSYYKKLVDFWDEEKLTTLENSKNYFLNIRRMCKNKAMDLREDEGEITLTGENLPKDIIEIIKWFSFLFPEEKPVYA